MRLILPLCLLAAPLALAQPSGLVVHNARIYTVNVGAPAATAMAMQDGRIVAVGSDAEVLAARADWERLDAAGRTIVPGLIDAHAHLMGLGKTLLEAGLVGATSVDDVIDRLRQFAQSLPPGAWIVGRGWDQNDWPEATYPTAADLDRVYPDRPVWLERVDGHAFWGNSAAMRAAGIDPAAPAPADPPGGSIIREPEGRPTGVFVDNATLPIDNAVPAPGEELLAARLRAALRETTRHGLTGIHEAGLRPDTLRMYQRFIDAGEFPIRVYGMIEGAGELLNEICTGGPVEGDRLVVRSMKLYADGALGSRGAALLEDYEDLPGHRGTLLLEPAALRATLTHAMRCGLQVNTHAIGDRGVRAALDAYEAALRETGAGNGRHRIEHVQVVSDADFPRFATLGIIASVQPTHATSDMPWAEARVGPDRIRGAYAWRRLLDAGARLALGSDFPAESVDPLRGFYAAVTRQDPDGSPPEGWRADEQLTREEALRGFTLDAAYAGFMEDEVGSLEIGKRADFVILSRDIMSVPAPEILQTRVLATYIDGEPVYRAGAGE